VADSLAKKTLTLLVMSLGLGLCVGALISVGAGFEPVQFAVNAAVSTLYSASIGVPAMIVLTRLKPRLFGKPELRQWLTYAGVILTTAAVGTLFARFVLAALGLITFEEMWSGYLESIEIGMAICVPITIGAVTFSQLQARLAKSDNERRRALALATEARLASLESRVRPHFLFNALNSAIALIPEDPRRAENVLERLCALLRFSLDAHTRLVPLGEELRIVVDYLEIERVRFGDRLTYELDVAEDLNAIEVPAFAVQTLVENSVKYAVSVRKQGARILIRARRVEGRLEIDIADDGPGFVGPIWVPGHGLDGLRARLDALYGDSARLVAPVTAGAGAAVRIEIRA
jgi:signal transduction histidine kinase